MPQDVTNCIYVLKLYKLYGSFKVLIKILNLMPCFTAAITCVTYSLMLLRFTCFYCKFNDNHKRKIIFKFIYNLIYWFILQINIQSEKTEKENILFVKFVYFYSKVSLMLLPEISYSIFNWILKQNWKSTERKNCIGFFY